MSKGILLEWIPIPTHDKKNSLIKAVGVHSFFIVIQGLQAEGESE
jgi:hypothetical protein